MKNRLSTGAFARITCLTLTAMFAPLLWQANAAEKEAPAPEPDRGVQVTELRAAQNEGILLFQQAAGQEILVTLKNTGAEKRTFTYKTHITGYDEVQRWSGEGTCALDPGATQQIKLTFDTSKWPFGPYDGEFNIFADTSSTTPLLKRIYRLGVITSTTLEKARAGEFLYGLDVANNYIYPIHTPVAYTYYRLLGTDIIRGIFEKGQPRTVDQIGILLKKLGDQGLQSMLMWDPPRANDPAKRQADLKDTVSALERIGELYTGSGPGYLHYFELGNEPDLPRFYPPSIQEFAETFYAMREALKIGARKKGLKDSDTLVFNGGLSFAGPTGDKRSREYLELLDFSRTDAIGYHGHGPLIGAERSAYERVYAAAAKYGKATKPFVETESGFSGHDREGLVTQARTVTEKFAYGQSKSLPLLIYFRLFMEGTGVEGGYGMTRNFIEPHPSVMAYRNTVEQLRHHRFARELPYASSDKNLRLNLFLFEEFDAAQKRTGRKVLVAFRENAGRSNLRFTLDAAENAVSQLALVDLYGNTNAPEMSSNTVAISVGLDPVYLVWKSSGPAEQVKVAPPLMSATLPDNSILPGAETVMSVSLNGQEKNPVTADLKIDSRCMEVVTVAPATQSVTLTPGQLITATASLTVDPAQCPPDLPRWWKVFPDIDPMRLSAKDFAAIPDELPGKEGAVTGRFAATPNNRIEMAKIAGGFGEKRAAVAYAVLDVAKPVTLKCGATADWYMAWYLNGEKVLDTLEKGNEAHGSIARHPFTLSLKAGRNILAVQVQSGSGGWMVEFGGPRELRAAQDMAERLLLTLRSGGKTLSVQEVPVAFHLPVGPIGSLSSSEKLNDWMPLEPSAALAESAVLNHWVKEPDSSKWYKGESDLSACYWLRDGGKTLHAIVAVFDDKEVSPSSSSTMETGDSLRLVVADEDGKSLLDISAAKIGGVATLSKSMPGVTLSMSREDATASTKAATLYHIEFPKSLVGAKPFRVNFSVADNDAGYLKQNLNYGNVEQPVQGRREIVLP